MTRYLLAALLLSACAPPDLSATFTRLDVQVVDDAADANALLADAIDSAEDTVRVALPSLQDDTLADAMIAAWDRGVDLEWVTDTDYAELGPAVRVQDADIPTTLADSALEYFDFGTNVDLAWGSDQVKMSHSYVVVDGANVWTSSRSGDVASGPRVVFHLTGEDIAEDFSIEHNQLFGGVDAAATTAFDAPAKSIADARWAYSNQTELTVELWFGPQERLTKRAIDAIYDARSSVRILTDDFSNEGVVAALQSKASYGFDTEIMVGPAFGAASAGLAALLRYTTPDVTKLEWTDGSSDATVPTLIFIDADENAGGAGNNAQVMVISHDLYSAARTFNLNGIEELQGREELTSQDLSGVAVTDQLIDGHMWVLQAPGEPSGFMADLFSLYAELRSESEVLQ